MMSKTHLTSSITAILVAGVSTPVAGGILLGTFLPDLDSRNSKINRKLKVFRFFMSKRKDDTKHRSILHNPLILLLLLPFYKDPLTLGVMIGYGLHLFLDAMTPESIPFLRFLRIFRIRSNSLKENILFLGLFMFNVYLLVG